MSSEILTFGGLVLEILPRNGGSIFSFMTSDGCEIFRSGKNHTDEPTELASFPLVPFSNRIRNGKFVSAGKNISLPSDAECSPHAIHGHGWKTSWQIESRSTNKLHLSFEHQPDEWPWSYKTDQFFRLEEGRFVHTLRITNTSAEVMPVGLGLHPYFAHRDRAYIQTGVHSAYETDDDHLPIARNEDHPAIGCFKAGKIVTEGLHAVFSRWNGIASISWPDRNLRVEMEADPLFGHLCVYAPRGQSYFCVEPVSHATDAFNLYEKGWVGTGCMDLQPQSVLEGCVSYTVLRTN
ncbi:MAG: hypothetical protein COB90_06200 [Hyphomicrobiales bacterium]|nr:MAG: hypothetical protein COB90_06200 [Hyphomicrobiales bacterium]